MDLEKIEIRKFFFKKSGFRSSKTINFYYIVIPIFSKPFTCRIVNYPVDEEVFWKNGAAKVFDFNQKNQFEKKIGGHLELRALAFNSGWSPIFLNPREIPLFVRYFKPMFVSGN